MGPKEGLRNLQHGRHGMTCELVTPPCPLSLTLPAPKHNCNAQAKPLSEDQGLGKLVQKYLLIPTHSQAGGCWQASSSSRDLWGAYGELCAVGAGAEAAAGAAALQP